jgi:hypothetical protein
VSAVSALPDLLTLAVDLATTLQRRDHIPGLAEVAARKGSSATVTQGRRLEKALHACPVRAPGHAVPLMWALTNS